MFNRLHAIWPKGYQWGCPFQNNYVFYSKLVIMYSRIILNFFFRIQNSESLIYKMVVSTILISIQLLTVPLL